MNFNRMTIAMSIPTNLRDVLTRAALTLPENVNIQHIFKISAQGHELYELATISHVYLWNHCMKSSNTKHPKERYLFLLRVLSLFCLYCSFSALSSSTPHQFNDGYLALYSCYSPINLGHNIIIQFSKSSHATNMA
jgi:hypothetical protein